MSKSIKLMLVEDSPEYRETIALAVEREEDIRLTGQFGTVEEALSYLEDNLVNVPDVVLLDLNLPGLSGIDAIPLFLRVVSKLQIIVLTQSDRKADVVYAVAAGANGYLLKGSTRRQIFDGVRMVKGGGAMIDPEMAIHVLNVIKSSAAASKSAGGILAKRELQILTLLASGMVQKEISNQLDITNNTVATHIRRIYEKLNVQNAPAAVAKAFREGIFPK